MSEEKKVKKIWLHKSLKESKLFIKNEDYEKAIKDGWKLNRKDTIKKKK